MKYVNLALIFAAIILAVHYLLTPGGVMAGTPAGRVDNRYISPLNPEGFTPGNPLPVDTPPIPLATTSGQVAASIRQMGTSSKRGFTAPTQKKGGLLN